jgi:predicted transcriptional regulator
VAVRREGKSNLYTPLVGCEAYQAFDSRAVLERLYGSPRNFVAALARDGMGRSELEELRALLDQLNGGQER